MSSVSTKWLVGIGALIAVLVVASVLIAVLGPGNTVADYPAGSPEGVVQRYLQAIDDGDSQLALSMMEAQARDGCTVQEVSQQSQWFIDYSDRRRLEIVDTTDLSDGSKQVRVRVTEVNVSPPFGVDENSYYEWYTLLDEDGAWVLKYPAWPLSYCQSVQPDKRNLP